MTSDAKIGLLLGLVFIFIIAFIINGLPSFRKETNNNELTTNMVGFQNDSVGLGAKERKAQKAFDWAELTKKQSLWTDGSQTSLEKAPKLEEAIRSILPIPQGPSIAKEQNSDNEIEQKNETAETSLAFTERINKPEPSQQAFAKVYVVRDGDNLSGIAKKFYGPEQGNKIANVERIFTANRHQLGSPDDIYVGQKIIIPPLPISNSIPSRIDGTLPDTMFERVEAIGKKRLKSSEQRIDASKWYTVRDGDNLWKIAAGQLGNGARYSEIAKLNADILYDEDNISIGMRLRLPTQSAAAD
jgi:nucleoid-associated protein YgaU